MDLKEKQIIYVDNKSHIKCGVVMLPVDASKLPNCTQGLIVKCIKSWTPIGDKPKEINKLSISKNWSKGVLDYYEGQHLYITSDEEIKKDDWYLDTQTKEIKQYIDTSRTNSENILWNSCKKIIATTNSKLSTTSRTEIPQPSPKFIEKYIEEYNKGHQITEVLVEVEELKTCIKCGAKMSSHYLSCQYPVCEGTLIQELKLNSQNQITIRKQKDNWNKEEVIKLIDKLGYDLSPLGGRNEYSKIKSKWIKENL